MEKEELLSQEREMKTVLDGLIHEFHEKHEPDKNGKFFRYKDKTVREFVSHLKRHNKLSLELMRRFLGERFGERYRGVYPAAGTDDYFPEKLKGSEWFCIDRAYEFDKKMWGKRILFYLLDRLELLEGFLRPPIIRYVPHDLESSEFPDVIEPGSFQVALLKHPLGHSTNLERYRGYESPVEGKNWRTDSYENALEFALESLDKSGILVAEPVDVTFEYDGEPRTKANEIFGKHLKGGHIIPVKNILGVEGLDEIDFYTYEERSRSTKPRNLKFGFYEKL